MATFRLDQPNFQVSSEEIQSKIKDKLTKVFGVPIKDKLEK